MSALLLEWIVVNHIDAVASIAGVCISIIGFAVTLHNVYRSKNAAQRAEIAALKAQKTLRLFDTVADASKAISLMDEAKRLNRAGE